MNTQRMAEELAEQVWKAGNRHGPDAERKDAIKKLIATALQAAADNARAEDNVATLHHMGNQLFVRFPDGNGGYTSFPVEYGMLTIQYKNWLDSTTPPHTPRTAQQSEAVIAKAMGQNLTVVKEGADHE